MNKIINDMKEVCGIAPELTVRGDKEFTFSFETVQRAAADHLRRFFESHATVEVEHDDECGTFVYVSA